jgi:hypothetical protein
MLLFMPHIYNLGFVFKYFECGLIQINPDLKALPLHWNKAQALLKLVNVDKHPGNHKFASGDKRWELRRQEWETATIYLGRFQSHEISPEQVVDYAKRRGFFSVWYSVFNEYPKVL